MLLVHWRVKPGSSRIDGRTVSTPLHQSLGWTPRQREKSPEDLIGWKCSPLFTPFFWRTKTGLARQKIYHVDFLGGGGEKFWKMDEVPHGFFQRFFHKGLIFTTCFFEAVHVLFDLFFRLGRWVNIIFPGVWCLKKNVLPETNASKKQHVQKHGEAKLVFASFWGHYDLLEFRFRKMSYGWFFQRSMVFFWILFL